MPCPRTPLATAVAAALAVIALCAEATHAAPEPAPNSESAPEPTRGRGRALLAANDLAGAEAVFAALVAKDDADAQSWMQLGFARHRAGKLESALVAHRKAATFPPVRALAHYNATCALTLLGRPDEALEALRDAAAAGFRDRGLLASDPDLAALRKDARLATVLRPLLRGADAFVEPVRVLQEIDGGTPGEQFGWVARVVGDLDGDGAADFVATSPTRGPRGSGSGRASVYSSRTGRLLFTVEGLPGDALGTAAAAAGDVDGDLVPDLIVGAPQGAAAPGYALVVSGKTGAVLLRVTGEAAADQFGAQVCGAGDVDGDGRADIAVGAFRADGKSGVDAGRVTVHSGRTGAVLVRIDGERAGDLFGAAIDAAADGAARLLAVGAMNGGPGGRGRVQTFRLAAGDVTLRTTIEASATGAHFGQYFVAFAGDFDGDGTQDVFASDFEDAAKGPGTGRAVVVSGKDGARLLDLPGTRAGENFGTSRSVCGDVDADGRPDLVVGAWQSAEGAPAGGRCSVVSGRDGKVLATYTSRMDGDTLGFDAVGVGDVDGDGGTDFLLSAAWSEVHGARTGRVWIVAGPTAPKPRRPK